MVFGYPNEVYTTISFFGFVMCIVPFPCHLKAWNGGTCLLMFWAGMGCLVFFINSIVWNGNTLNRAPIWCDICTKLVICCLTGVPASSLCINRRLYLLLSDPARNAPVTKSEKLRVLAVDLSISAGLPILIMILHYIAQGQRFDIYEDIGCCPDTSNTLVGAIMLGVPPIITGLVSASYGISAIISINKNHNQFNELLSRPQGITSSLYFRLMCFAGMEALCTTPITCVFLVYDMKHNRLLSNLGMTSFEFSHVDQYPAIILHNIPTGRVFDFARWTPILCAIIAFSCFGFTQEARFHYRLAIKLFLKVIGIRIGRQTETFQNGRISTSDSAGRLSRMFSNKTRPMVLTPLGGDKGEKQSLLRTVFRGTHTYAHGQLEARMNPNFPTACYIGTPSTPMAPRAFMETMVQSNSLVTTTNTPIPAVIEQGSRTRNLGHDELSYVFARPSQTDLSFMEEGQPSVSTANYSPTNPSRSSRHFHSFLNFN